MTGILPGRFVPESGTLHKYPATEQCNLDDTEADIRVETLADVQALPPKPILCGHCFTISEQESVTERWPELAGEVPTIEDPET